MYWNKIWPSGKLVITGPQSSITSSLIAKNYKVIEHIRTHFNINKRWQAACQGWQPLLCILYRKLMKISNEIMRTVLAFHKIEKTSVNFRFSSWKSKKKFDNDDINTPYLGFHLSHKLLTPFITLMTTLRTFCSSWLLLHLSRYFLDEP